MELEIEEMSVCKEKDVCEGNVYRGRDGPVCVAQRGHAKQQSQYQ